MKKQIIFFLVSTAMAANLWAQPGTLDSTFNTGTGFDNLINDMALQSDGKIVVVGTFEHYNDSVAKRIARLNPDGSLDTTFKTGIGFPEQVASVEIDANGKIYVGGGFYSYNDTTAGKIVRLNSDGSMDLTFNLFTGFNDYVHSIKLTKENKILVAGSFTQYHDTTAMYIARLDMNGNLDTTFKGALDGYAKNTMTVSGEKILVLGGFTKAGGVNRNLIALLNPDGSLDSTFDAGNLFTLEMQDAIEINGKYLVGGYFGNYNLLNTDGSVDNSFTKISGSNNALVNTFALSGDKILFGGAYFGLGGSSSSNFTSVQLDGSLNGAFLSGSGFEGEVRKIIAVGDSLIYVGGGVTSYDGKTIKSIVRLKAKAEVGVGIQQVNSNSLLTIYPNPFTDVISLNTSAVTKLVVLDAVGKEVFSLNTPASQVDLSGLSEGMYFMNVYSDTAVQIVIVVKQ